MSGITTLRSIGNIVKETVRYPKHTSYIDRATGLVTKRAIEVQPTAKQIFNRMIEVLKGVFSR